MTDKLVGLHVEDSVDIYYVLRAVMELQGCDLRLATNRTQFLSEMSKPFDFIIFDGYISGWDLPDYLEDIRTLCKVPFFIYSGSSQAQLKPFYQLGAEGVFEKRHGFKTLCACVYSRFGVVIKSSSEMTDPGRANGT